jgi:hypothetical protein
MRKGNFIYIIPLIFFPFLALLSGMRNRGKGMILLSLQIASTFPFLPVLDVSQVDVFFWVLLAVIVIGNNGES